MVCCSPGANSEDRGEIAAFENPAISTESGSSYGPGRQRGTPLECAPLMRFGRETLTAIGTLVRGSRGLRPWPRRNEGDRCRSPSAGSAASFGATTQATWRCGGALCAQTLPSLGATPLDHQSSSSRSHPDKKSVGSFSTTIVGLERSLHCLMESSRKVELFIL